MNLIKNQHEVSIPCMIRWNGKQAEHSPMEQSHSLSWASSLGVNQQM